MTDTPRAIVFDLYGTLLDVSSVEDGCKSITADPAIFVTLWRQKQLEYSWLRGLSGRYVDFWAVTADALRYTCARLRIDLSVERVVSLLDLWMHLAPYPEVPAALERLGAYPLGVLSNGSPGMIEAGLTNAGLRDRIAARLSVDAVKTYKPAPSVYALAPAHFRISASEILFVSGNAWDVAGARAAGLRVCRLNRTGLPMDELGEHPDLEVPDLTTLAERLP
jgi:2-haloacid dehalogenase